ncbi:hypothetical protein WAF17_14100 [Bernardetia sp. ABR2-2B]|uniref:hypothetical protein n=1 Tax=Bernardetia sp. ABR2-2B TaxID=3127472 RepID=UPI0030D2B66F
MKDNIRYSCWLIDNIKFSGKEFTKTINFNGEKIELLITKYENLKDIEEPFHDWIHNKIVNHSMRNLSNNPLPINSIFVLTKNGYTNHNSQDFSYLFRLCLKLVYYQPTLISKVSEFIPDAAIIMPTWENVRNMRTISKNEITSDTFNKVLSYFDTLSKLDRNCYSVFEEIYKKTEINEVLIELLALYSFIEGFWHNQRGKSNIDKSIRAMLQDYIPQKEEKFKREVIIRKIKSQNELFNQSSIDKMRNILAHGMYKSQEDSWSNKQWKAIFEQRNLIIELVIDSLVNRLKCENQLSS